MPGKKIIIIGAGIAGLSAASYLQRNGYSTEIFELAQSPGGLCTSWKRKGYTFDGCIHWLVGTHPSFNFYKFWKELGAIQNKKIINFDFVSRIEGRNGEVFTVYTDANKLEAEMNRIAPEDKESIKNFINAIRKTARNIEVPIEKVSELRTAFENIKILFKIFPLIRIFTKFNKMSIDEYAKKFKNLFLREAFPQLLWGDKRISLFYFLVSFAWMHKKSAGYPIGGSLAFSKAIEENYRKLGGKVNYGSRVVKVRVENDRATGIQMEDGSIHWADIIISGADGHDTIFNMLEGKYISQKIVDNYNNMVLFSSLIQVSLGISKNLEHLPVAVTFPLKTPFTIDDKNISYDMFVRIYNFDPTLAPPGKTSLVILLPGNYEYWTELKAKDIHKYNEEKDRIAREVIERLDEHFKGIASNVEVYDVATPATYVRYTNNWKASFEGWLPTPTALTTEIPKKLTNLDNFYMVGQWVEPGGSLPIAAKSGRDVAQIICKQDGKKFRT